MARTWSSSTVCRLTPNIRRELPRSSLLTSTQEFLRLRNLRVSLRDSPRRAEICEARKPTLFTHGSANGVHRCGPPKRQPKRSTSDVQFIEPTTASSGDGCSACKGVIVCHDWTTTMCCFKTHDNDPSAGSPTETLLRLLLPLDDQVRPSSRNPAQPLSRNGTSPRASLNHPIGSSDGRCVQRAGT